MSEAARLRRIVFVPGQQPKPAAPAYREQLWRCLLAAAGRQDAAVREALATRPEILEVTHWNSLVYPTERPLAGDMPWIDRLLAREGADERDIAEAYSWPVRLTQFLYTLADHYPFVASWVPGEIQRTLATSRVYFEDRDGMAGCIRGLLRALLEPLLSCRADVLLIGHSLGSVIAWDTLWELSRTGIGGRIELFLSLGSPLGVRFVQKRLLGADQRGAARYPRNVRRWINIAAVGELRAIDRFVRNDFREMERQGLIETIEDRSTGVYNHYRDARGLNVHSAYGYLANVATGRVVAEWWQGPRGDQPRDRLPRRQAAGSTR